MGSYLTLPYIINSIICRFYIDKIIYSLWITYIYEYFGPSYSWLLCFPFIPFNHLYATLLRNYCTQEAWQTLQKYIFLFPFLFRRGPQASEGPSPTTGLPESDAKQDLPCHCPIVAVLPSFFSLLLLWSAHGKSCQERRERGEERTLKARKRSANAISWALSFFTRAAQFRFQSQMQTNRCLCFCTCNDNKAQLSAREQRKLLRSLNCALSHCARSLSQSLSVDCPSFPPPTVKTRSLIAHLSSCQQSEPHWVVTPTTTTQITTVWHQLHMWCTCSKAISFFIF